MSQSIRIVRPAERDREFLADIAPFFMSKEVRKAMPYLSDTDATTWFLAVRAGRVVGIGSVTPGKRGEALIGGLYVVPAARGTGVATALVDARLAFVEALGAEPVTVANPASAPLYLRRGFHEFFRRGSYAHLRRA